MILFNRYSIKINDNDWKELENVMINELENILFIKINSHKELVEALELLKKNYRNYFLRLENKLKLNFRVSKDSLSKKKKPNKENRNKIENEDKDEDKNGGGGIRVNKKKKKNDLEYIYF